MSDFLKQKRIILATGSPIRQKLFASLGLEFECIPSHCDESSIKAAFDSSQLIDLGYALAKAKALEVSKAHPEAWIIAADQLCITEYGILDKPMVHESAIEHLKLLRGKTHQQAACMCIAKAGEILWTHHDVALLTMKYLDDAVINAYLHEDKPYHSCGAYQYESMGKWLFESVEGSEDTILGLTLNPLIKALTDLNICTIEP